MFKKVSLDRSRIKDLVLAMTPLLAVVVIIMVLFFKYVDPAPPKRVVISAGDPDGQYYAAAKQYRDLIKAEGIDLEIMPSKGGWENVKRLEDPLSGVEVAFIQDGLGDRKKQPNVTSLGSLYYEPIWLFYRSRTEMNRLNHLVGQKIAVGERGGETHTMAKKLLTASGVTEVNAEWKEMNEEAAASALRAGKVDAAFFISSAENPLLQQLLQDPIIKLMSMDQAEAMTRQFPYLHHLTLPHGTIDLGKNLPEHDVELVAATATLVARNTLHPALVYLLLKAASKVHHQAGIFEKKWEFPIDKDYIYPVNVGAKEYFKSGAPFWLKYLPFWLATIMQRFIFIVLPVGAVVIPLLKLIPRFMNWRVRSRIYQGYGELKLLEDRIDTNATPEQIHQYVQSLEGIDSKIHRGKFPVDVFDDVYLLREHIHFVRERLNRMASGFRAKRIG